MWPFASSCGCCALRKREINIKDHHANCDCDTTSDLPAHLLADSHPPRRQGPGDTIGSRLRNHRCIPFIILQESVKCRDLGRDAGRGSGDGVGSGWAVCRDSSQRSHNEQRKTSTYLRCLINFHARRRLNDRRRPRGATFSEDA